MIKEFEGKDEQEAIEKAIKDLGLERDEFDVEILEKSKKGLFKKGPVKIKVYLEDEEEEVVQLEPNTDFEKELIEFIETLILKMGYEVKVFVSKRENSKINLMIETNDANILIGKKGKNLDAIQLLASVFATKKKQNYKIILDIEGYRAKREETLKIIAEKTATQVRKTKNSKLLEPMNPFERRIIHTTLSSYVDIDTISEGEGLYKKVRVIFKKNYKY